MTMIHPNKHTVIADSHQYWEWQGMIPFVSWVELPHTPTIYNAWLSFEEHEKTFQTHTGKKSKYRSI
jgi:hypothetical protein